jgi:predicted enzyme related to lactoylglutathione lyase
MGDTSYTEWLLDGKSIAGALPMGDNFPPEVPPHWLVYFAVSDTDAAVNTATRLGARTLMPVMDAPVGRFAALTDPQGAAFGVITLAGGM